MEVLYACSYESYKSNFFSLKYLSAGRKFVYFNIMRHSGIQKNSFHCLEAADEDAWTDSEVVVNFMANDDESGIEYCEWAIGW